MARIRTIKPEFWDSPSTARASAVARLAFIALWNWADDYGRGTANLKELEGFIFPNDDIAELSSGNTVHFRDVLAEIADAFGVVFYTAHGRPYFDIPSWDQHQRNERRAKASKHPGPDQADTETPGNTGENDEGSENTASVRPTVAETPHNSGAGTGEQGNRGTEEQGNSDAAEPAPDDRPEVEALCTLLADQIEANGSKRPTIGKTWRDACRLMIDRDNRTPQDVEAAIRWSQKDSFWKSNILSMPKLREKFDALRLHAQREASTTGNRATDRMMAGYQAMAGYEANQVDPWTVKEIEG